MDIVEFNQLRDYLLQLRFEGDKPRYDQKRIDFKDADNIFFKRDGVNDGIIRYEEFKEYIKTKGFMYITEKVHGCW